jgi:prepilin-type N-terminal cleavage/methylation domain-containing protein
VTPIALPLSKACRGRPPKRCGFSLIELASVLAVVALLAAAGLTRWGSGTVENVSGESFARRLALDLMQARRRTIATGDNHYLQLSPAAGNVTSYMIYRRASGGDVVVEQTRTTPSGSTVAASHATLEFDFDGAALAAYSVTVTAPSRSWTVSTVMATGAVQTTATP